MKRVWWIILIIIIIVVVCWIVLQWTSQASPLATLPISTTVNSEQPSVAESSQSQTEQEAINQFLGLHQTEHQAATQQRSIEKFVVQKNIVDERAAIQRLVDRYYNALRAKDFQLAASLYDPQEVGEINMAKLLETACSVLGIPPVVRLAGVQIEGDRAKGETFIDREGHGPVYYKGIDSHGNDLGTWARTLHFVKRDDEWKISLGGAQSVEGLQLGKTHDLLDELEKKK
ncbi:hypothetical protein JXA32_16150 [Candidatus Sumerlaeota bacterium]|nr:hypothetical protein [Candidatus Sumerlaeota bacterium]